MRSGRSPTLAVAGTAGQSGVEEEEEKKEEEKEEEEEEDRGRRKKERSHALVPAHERTEETIVEYEVGYKLS
ncbi:hypothetical protein K0M31_001549 [Melipona bicolor]|uniref:Uncharacterized protein n=1 Tax=Melipona bicolor TaxID=60889 RepID=A0AA40GFQ6_9HYME|nr:hypothetical protein K0M31_001549 [Melipona bicolor]